MTKTEQQNRIFDFVIFLSLLLAPLSGHFCRKMTFLYKVGHSTVYGQMGHSNVGRPISWKCSVCYLVWIRVRNHERNRARKIFFALSKPGFDIHFPFFKIFQFYNWPREISRDDVTKINLLWIKITFLDYLTPFIPNGLTIPLRPSSALNQDIQSAFESVSANPDSQFHLCLP